MTKHLFLIRHARTAERAVDMKDIDRPLTLEGIQNASKMGRFFLLKNISPDSIMSSTALRAKTSAELMAEQMNYDTAKIYMSDKIYEASARTLLQIVNAIKEEFKTVLLIGHNPSISFLAEYITGEEIGDVTNCGVIRIKCKNISWEEIDSGNGELADYYYPEIISI
ncbi:MAG: histidine phosphatase family protein [Bacteroidetes bacterium]|nr:histidine phosphatase family protein [Bacteroidota bacterium]